MSSVSAVLGCPGGHAWQPHPFEPGDICQRCGVRRDRRHEDTPCVVQRVGARTARRLEEIGLVVRAAEVEAVKIDGALRVLEESLPNFDAMMAHISGLAAQFIRRDTLLAIQVRRSDDLLWASLSSAGVLPNQAFNGRGECLSWRAIVNGFGQQIMARLPQPEPAAEAA